MEVAHFGWCCISEIDDYSLLGIQKSATIFILASVEAGIPCPSRFELAGSSAQVFLKMTLRDLPRTLVDLAWTCVHLSIRGESIRGSRFGGRGPEYSIILVIRT